MHRAVFAVALLGFAAPALAQEQEDWSTSFARITGGAVYDYKEGVDGTLVSEDYMLTHVVCSDGSRSLRVMVPVAPEDNDITFTMDGAASTLKKTGSTYQVVVTASGQRFTKELELKPVNDPKSHYAKQFMMRVDYGDVLWRAMVSPTPGEAMMLIGTGGTPISVPPDEKLTQALSSCGLKG